MSDWSDYERYSTSSDSEFLFCNVCRRSAKNHEIGMTIGGVCLDCRDGIVWEEPAEIVAERKAKALARVEQQRDMAAAHVRRMRLDPKDLAFALKALGRA